MCFATNIASGLYYHPVGESAENLRFIEIIDKQFLETSWYSSRQMARIMNTDQGSQFTGFEWSNTLSDAKIKISMDGRGRWIDNRMIERL